MQGWDHGADLLSAYDGYRCQDCPVTYRGRHWMAVSGIGETVEVTVRKHPYQHPYGIAPCVR